MNYCFCGKAAHQLCSGCHEKWYCSVECQERDWPLHAKVCLNYAHANPSLNYRGQMSYARLRQLYPLRSSGVLAHLAIGGKDEKRPSSPLPKEAQPAAQVQKQTVTTFSRLQTLMISPGFEDSPKADHGVTIKLLEIRDPEFRMFVLNVLFPNFEQHPKIIRRNLTRATGYGERMKVASILLAKYFLSNTEIVRACLRSLDHVNAYLAEEDSDNHFKTFMISKIDWGSNFTELCLLILPLCRPETRLEMAKHLTEFSRQKDQELVSAIINADLLTADQLIGLFVNACYMSDILIMDSIFEKLRKNVTPEFAAHVTSLLASDSLLSESEIKNFQYYYRCDRDQLNFTHFWMLVGASNISAIKWAVEHKMLAQNMGFDVSAMPDYLLVPFYNLPPPSSMDNVLELIGISVARGKQLKGYALASKDLWMLIRFVDTLKLSDMDSGLLGAMLRGALYSLSSGAKIFWLCNLIHNPTGIINNKYEWDIPVNTITDADWSFAYRRCEDGTGLLSMLERRGVEGLELGTVACAIAGAWEDLGWGDMPQARQEKMMDILGDIPRLLKDLPYFPFDLSTGRRISRVTTIPHFFAKFAIKYGPRLSIFNRVMLLMYLHYASSPRHSILKDVWTALDVPGLLIYLIDLGNYNKIKEEIRPIFKENTESMLFSAKQLWEKATAKWKS
jgi:hypothetical protein